MPRRVIAATLLLALLPAADASACSIPVFRYALERWVPSPFDVFVFRRGPLDEGQEQTVRRLREARTSNIKLIDVDLDDKPDPKWLKVQARLPTDQALPLMAVRGPDADSKSALVWVAPVTETSVDALLDSTVRRNLVSRLGRGQTAVLLILESGDPSQDEPIVRMLDEERQFLEKTRLPEPSEKGTQPRSSLPLKVIFSTMRLSRSNADEALLVRMLLASEPGLDKVGGPIVFAIFGRGRLLAALHGNDLNADELNRVAEFLCKKCTCELKDLNPGSDLLFTADWEGFVEGTSLPPEERDSETALNAPASRYRSLILWSAAPIAALIILLTVVAARSLRRTAGG